MIYQTYRYELKPSREQEHLFYCYAGTARWAYNYGLGRQFEALATGDKFPTDLDLHKEVVQLKKTDEFSWLKGYSKWVPQNALRNLKNAWKNKREGRSRCPRYKAKGKCRDSFQLDNPVWVRGKTAFLPTIGQVRTKEDTGKLKGKVKHVTVVREADRWYNNC